MIEAIGRAIVAVGRAIENYGFKRWQAKCRKTVSPRCDGGVPDDDLIEDAKR